MNLITQVASYIWLSLRISAIAPHPHPSLKFPQLSTIS